VVFSNLSWNDAKHRAQNEQKNIFIVLYDPVDTVTSELVISQISNDTVDYLFNYSFVNLKIKAETQRAHSFLHDHPTSQFPSIYFVSVDGKVLFKSTDQLNPDSLYKVAEIIANPKASHYYYYKNRLESTDYTSTDLFEYFIASYYLYKVFDYSASEYLNNFNPTNWKEHDSTMFIYCLSSIGFDTPYTNYFTYNYREIFEYYQAYDGTEFPMGKFSDLVTNEAKRCAKVGEKSCLQNLYKFGHIIFHDDDHKLDSFIIDVWKLYEHYIQEYSTENQFKPYCRG